MSLSLILLLMLLLLMLLDRDGNKGRREGCDVVPFDGGGGWTGKRCSARRAFADAITELMLCCQWDCSGGEEMQSVNDVADGSFSMA